MCEHGEMGCPECGADHDHITYETTGYSDISYSVYPDGTPCERQNVSDPDDDGHEGSLYCGNCGHGGFTELAERDLTDCECDECDPPPPNDPDEVVTLVRPRPAIRPDAWPINMPNEIRLLLSRRSIRQLPVRYERAEELEAWANDEWGHGQAFVKVHHERPSQNSWNLRTPEPEEEAA